MLEVEEVQKRRGLRVAGGADDKLRRQMHQIGDTLQMDGKRATVQDAARERPGRREVPVTNETEGAGDISTSDRTGSSEKPSEIGSVSVRSIAMGCGS